MSTEFKQGDKVKVAKKLPLKLRGFPSDCTGTIAEVQGNTYSIELEDGRRIGWFPGEVLSLDEEGSDD